MTLFSDRSVRRNTETGSYSVVVYNKWERSAGEWWAIHVRKSTVNYGCTPTPCTHPAPGYNTVHTSKSLSSVLALPFDLRQGSWGQCTVVQFYSAPLLSVSLSVGLNTVILYADWFVIMVREKEVEFKFSVSFFTRSLLLLLCELNVRLWRLRRIEYFVRMITMSTVRLRKITTLLLVRLWQQLQADVVLLCWSDQCCYSALTLQKTQRIFMLCWGCRNILNIWKFCTIMPMLLLLWCDARIKNLKSSVFFWTVVVILLSQEVRIAFKNSFISVHKI